MMRDPLKKKNKKTKHIPPKKTARTHTQLIKDYMYSMESYIYIPVCVCVGGHIPYHYLRLMVKGVISFIIKVLFIFSHGDVF